MTTVGRRPVGVGDQAPDFTRKDQSGKPVSLRAYRGRPVVLYFYPRDKSGACTAEACTFRDSYAAFTDAGAEVIGVSGDSDASHAAFASQNQLPFRLISDTDGAIRRLYGVPRKFGLLPGRVTYVIDPQGEVRSIFSAQFAPHRHVDAALHVLHELTPDPIREVA